ncbi:hypothetical protein ACROYT_G031402 [Oculina patagonica]
MDTNKKSSAKCGDVLHKRYSVLSFISMLLIVALFLRMESINRKTETNELRITNVERRIEIRSPQTTDNKDEMETPENAEYAENVVKARHHKNRREAAAQTQNSPKISLQQIHTEINKVCTPPGKICKVGPPGPPGDKGMHGYPGFKGEKGAPGKQGPQGPLGPTGAQGPTGRQGPQGPQGIKGEMGEEGSVGSPGKKGDVGLMGRPGIKGSPGPPGDRGAPGYPGYKGNKGAPGITGPQGPLGPTGAQGPAGSQGPQGSKGIKGEMGEKGTIGYPGKKGDVGPMGRKGVKGSIGLKGNKGYKGSIGSQGPKGECIIPPKIKVFPSSLDVFINKEATFYCWVDGQTSKRITWSKLGGASLTDTSSKVGVLRINNVQRSHFGSYMCTVYTGHGILRAISSLQLKEPPVITNKPPSRVFVDEGSTSSLCCEAAGSPLPNVQWSRADQSTLAFQENGCLEINTVRYKSDGDYICRATNRYGLAETATTVIVTKVSPCEEVIAKSSAKNRGSYELITRSITYTVYCVITADRKGWTLIARFSNNDNKNWMLDDGSWWYDQQVAIGLTNSPSTNADMISPAFWLASGREFKITRSDDPSHTPLLQTTGNCLAGQTFRSKITSYGDFRNGTVWASDKCLGSCTVQYGGQYKSTDGFQQAECSANIQSADKIGFWCHWDTGDGSVMMIGGGGSGCERADHGIGITEANDASFVEVHTGVQTEYDFGYEARTGSALASQSYSLNLWIR